MASNESDGFESASKLEGARRQSTISGNGQAADTTLDGQPGSTLLMPATHTLQQRPANPAPLGLLSIATIFFLLACYGVQARGVTAPNIFIGTVVFFGGLGQTIAGLMDFVAGNTVSFPPPTVAAMVQCNEENGYGSGVIIWAVVVYHPPIHRL